MEKETKNKDNQSPPSTCTTTAYPPSSTTAASTDYRDQPETKNPATNRETKRSKHCPTALWSGNSGFPFSFDPRYCNGVSTPEVTPKFGSFSLVTASTTTTTAAAVAEKIEKIADRKTKDEEEEEDGKRCIHQKRKIEEFMSGEFQVDPMQARRRQDELRLQMVEEEKKRQEVLNAQESLDPLTVRMAGPQDSQAGSDSQVGAGGSLGGAKATVIDISLDSTGLGEKRKASGELAGGSSAKTARITKGVPPRDKLLAGAIESGKKAMVPVVTSGEVEKKTGYSGGELKYLADPDFFNAPVKAIEWCTTLARDVGDVPPLPPVTKLNHGTIVKAFGKGVFQRVTGPVPAVLPEKAEEELARVLYDMNASHSFNMSRLAGVLGACSRFSSPGEDSSATRTQLAELDRDLKAARAEVDRLKADGEKNVSRIADVEKKLATSEKLRGELQASYDKLYNSHNSCAQIIKDRGERVVVLERKATEKDARITNLVAEVNRLELQMAKDKEQADFDVMEANDQGAFNIMRCVRRIFPEGGPTTEEIVKWMAGDLMDESLLAFHAEIPFSDRDVADFDAARVKVGKDPWAWPAKLWNNARDLCSQYLYGAPAPQDPNPQVFSPFSEDTFEGVVIPKRDGSEPIFFNPPTPEAVLNSVVTPL